MSISGPILFIQYGDFAEAFHRLAQGGAETYRDQRKSVNYLNEIQSDCIVVSLSRHHQPEQLTPHLLALGMLPAELDRARIFELLTFYKPRLIVLRTPHRGVLQAAARQNIPVMPCFADLFQGGGLRQWLSNQRLAWALRSAKVSCVANHNLNASRSIATVLGIPKNRIVPWDWSRLPCNPTQKTAPATPPRAFFAGALSVEKGVGDCLEALAVLRQRGVPLRFSFAGGGNLDAWQKLSQDLGIADLVDWLGMVPNLQVRDLMREHDLIVVPSHHSYAEGLPNTIYEAFASRTPLLLSDHPAFTGRVSPEACVTFRAAEPLDLADKIQNTLSDRDAYARLSAASERALQNLYIGIEWEDLMTRWLQDPLNQSDWVYECSLEALGY